MFSISSVFFHTLKSLEDLVKPEVLYGFEVFRSVWKGVRVWNVWWGAVRVGEGREGGL